MLEPEPTAESMRQQMDETPRTVCACSHCVRWCHSMPGALAPGDLERIQDHLGDHSEEFVTSNFVASEGARVRMRTREFNVPSITPAQKADGTCVFLDEHDRCRVHAVAPFGCSRFDCHQAIAEGEQRLRLLLAAQMFAHQRNGVYSIRYQQLRAVGRLAPPINVRRRRYAELEAAEHNTPQQESQDDRAE